MTDNPLTEDRNERIKRAVKADPLRKMTERGVAGAAARDPDALAALTEQIEAHPATPPADMTDAELNAAVAVEVMGWRFGIAEDRWPHYSSGYVKRVEDDEWQSWSPATDIAAAFEVVDRVKTMDAWKRDAFINSLCDDAHVNHFDAPCQAVASVMFRLSPRAICEAALQAVRADK